MTNPNLNLNKLVEKFNALNDQARYGILAGVVLLVLVLDIIFLVVPQLGGIAALEDQMKKLAADMAQVQTDKSRIDQLRKGLQDTQAGFNTLDAKVRSVQEVPAILSTISSIANQYGVKIEQLTPAQNQQEVLTSSPNAKYYALPIVIRAYCGYHMFGRFLSKLESEDLYFIVKDFVIENEGKTPNTHLFSVTIKMILVERLQPAKTV